MGYPIRWPQSPNFTGPLLPSLARAYREIYHMTKRDFDTTARIIGQTARDHSNLFTVEMIEAWITSYCRLAARHNPRFDPDRFTAAVLAYRAQDR